MSYYLHLHDDKHNTYMMIYIYVHTPHTCCTRVESITLKAHLPAAGGADCGDPLRPAGEGHLEPRHPGAGRGARRAKGHGAREALRGGQPAPRLIRRRPWNKSTHIWIIM